MDLFKTAQRIPPRRIPMVRRYETLPVVSNPLLVLPNKRPPVPLTVVGGFVGLVMVVGMLYQLSDPEASQPVTPQARPSTAPVPAASFRVVPAGAIGGGGGGGGGPAVGPLVTETAGENVIRSVRRLVFGLKKDPSTHANMTDRLALFAKYFNSLTPSDRIAMFGTIDFRQVEHAIRKRGEKSPQSLDRCLAQLQLILF